MKEEDNNSIVLQPVIKRKSEHLRIVLKEDVRHRGSNLLEEVQLLHDALAELDFNEIDLSSSFFGKKLSAPLMISSMTGGAEFSEKINRGLAEVARNFNIAFALGSQRVMLHHPETHNHFKVRKYFPDGVILGNIGATILAEHTIEEIVELVKIVEANGLCVHLNPAQEMIQADGERNYRGTLDNIARLVDALEAKVLVKETGAGMSPRVIERLVSIGVKYLDVAGAGGTSWTKVERYRARSRTLQRTGKTFENWGIPTAVSLLLAKKLAPVDTCIIASGGIETGLDSARAIAAGADITGFARAILNEYMTHGLDGASQFIETHIYELKTAMLLTGAGSIKDLMEVPRVFTGRLSEWLKGLESPQKES